MIKTIDEIYGEMLEQFARDSGYTPHDTCDLAVRLRTAAAQVQALYRQAQWIMEQSFPQTARGEWLEKHASLRGLRRMEAACAEGLIRFGIGSPAANALPIPAGTVCMTAGGERFATTEDAFVEAGSLYTDVPARAVRAGKSGNAAAGTVCHMAAMPTGVQACTNPAPFTGGEDQEDDDQLRQRLLDTYQRLPNGANAAYYEQTALSFPGVAAAVAVPRPRGVGSVDVYIAGEGGSPGAELLARVEAHLQKQREISVDLQVLAPAAVPVNISVAVRPRAGFTFDQVQAAAEKALADLFSGSLLGKGLKLAELSELLYHLEGVDNYRILAPAEDVVTAETVLPVAGTVTVTELEA